MPPKLTTLPITSISRTISFKNQNANACFQIISSKLLTKIQKNQTYKTGAREMAQCSRAAPEENPCSTPNSHGGSQIREHSSQPAATPAPRDPTPLFWFPQVPDLFIAHIQRAGENICTHKIKINLKKS